MSQNHWAELIKGTEPGLVGVGQGPDSELLPSFPCDSEAHQAWATAPNASSRNGEEPRVGEVLA